MHNAPIAFVDATEHSVATPTSPDSACTSNYDFLFDSSHLSSGSFLSNISNPPSPPSPPSPPNPPLAPFSCPPPPPLPSLYVVAAFLGTDSARNSRTSTSSRRISRNSNSNTNSNSSPSNSSPSPASSNASVVLRSGSNLLLVLDSSTCWYTDRAFCDAESSYEWLLVVCVVACGVVSSAACLGRANVFSSSHEIAASCWCLVFASYVATACMLILLATTAPTCARCHDVRGATTRSVGQVSGREIINNE